MSKLSKRLADLAEAALLGKPTAAELPVVPPKPVEKKP
jgi:hypothetical protein